MNKLLDSLINETNNLFSEILDVRIRDKIVDREDYLKLKRQRDIIYEKYPKISDFVEDMEPVNFNKNETKAFYELVVISQKMKALELKESFKLGAKEVIIFLKEQDML